MLALTCAAFLSACTETAPPTAPAVARSGASLSIDAGVVCTGVTTPVADCQALVALFNTTNGPGWADKTGWGVNPNPCAWAGITCSDDEHGSVRVISLSSNQLSGPIPASLGTMTNLGFLHLNNNALTGSIPPSLGNLTSLKELEITLNGLTGSIPPTLGNLSQLRLLWLSNNDLSGSIPAALSGAVALEAIQLKGNALTGSIPAALGALSQLEYLDLSENALTGTIPAALGSLAELDLLKLNDNQITGQFPAALGTLDQLRILDIENNALSGPIPNLAWWPILDRVHLHNNQFSGLLPVDVAVFAEGVFFGCTFVPGNPGLYMPDLPAYRAADTNGDGKICDLPFATAEDIGEDAVDNIDDLVPGTLNAGQANALKTKIENAIQKANKGQYGAAINQMQAFLTQLSGMVAAGTLTPAQAAPFIDQANALIAMWSGMV